MDKIFLTQADLSLGKELTAALVGMKKGDTLRIPRGLYGFNDTFFNPGVRLIGDDKEEVQLVSTSLFTQEKGSAFENTDDGSIYENLSLLSMCPMQEQQVCTGFARKNTSTLPPVNPGATAKYLNVIMFGRTHTLYTWCDVDATKLIAEYCKIICGKWNVVLGRSSGPNAGFIDLYRNEIITDANNSGYGGDTGSMALGIVGCGGRIRSFGDKISVKGKLETLTVRGIYANANPVDNVAGLNITAYGPDIQVDGYHGPLDIDAVNGTLNVVGGFGSDVGRRYLKGTSRLITVNP